MDLEMTFPGTLVLCVPRINHSYQQGETVFQDQM